MGTDAENRAVEASQGGETYVGTTQGPKRHQRPAKRPHGDEDWRIEDHACRVCFSRIVSRHAEGGRIYRCTGCGLEAQGHTPSVICACGLKFKNGHSMGVRCVVNEDPTPEAPAEVVARQVGA